MLFRSRGPTVSRSEIGALIASIQQLVNDDSKPIAQCLRNTLVLFERLGRDEAMRAWLLSELNGYTDASTLPDYRLLRRVQIKATFQGFGGSILRNQPLSPIAFPKEYFQYLEPLRISQGAPSLESLLSSEKGWLQLPVPPELVHLCQETVIDGMVLRDAWREIPVAALQQILENVRWRILQMTLELEKDFPQPEKGDEVAVDSAKVTQVVHQVFNAPVGNVATGSDIWQSAVVGLGVKDFVTLAASLRKIGVSEQDIADLDAAEQADKKEGKEPMKSRVGTWLAATMSKLLSSGGEVASQTAVQVLPKLILDHFGVK